MYRRWLCYTLRRNNIHQTDFKTTLNFANYMAAITELMIFPPLGGTNEKMIGKQNFEPRYALIVYLCAYLLRMSLERASNSCNGKRCARIRAKREKKGMRKVALRILKHSYVFFSLSCAAPPAKPLFYGESYQVG